jgi:hypothetical protein
LLLGQALRLVLDVDSDLRQRSGMLPAVVRAEEQFAGVGEQDADVRLGTAAIA